MESKIEIKAEEYRDRDTEIERETMRKIHTGNR